MKIHGLFEICNIAVYHNIILISLSVVCEAEKLYHALFVDLMYLGLELWLILHI